MTDRPAQITLQQWRPRYDDLRARGLVEPAYGGPLDRHLRDGDLRLAKLRFDNSPAALRLWNFLLTEEDRLVEARKAGKTLVGVMKDLGTSAVLAWAHPDCVAFYPDGAWWIPCVMELSAGLLDIADRLGVDESFCPVRAMLGAFVTGAHFPRPNVLTCAAGATCDDFSAIAQRLAGLGYPIHWWELPHRRAPEPGEQAERLPGGLVGPRSQIDFLAGQLAGVRDAIEAVARPGITEESLAETIVKANRVRALLGELRTLAYTAEPCPLGALEMLIAEMLALHFCSDIDECPRVLEDLLAETRRRVEAGAGVLPPGAARVFWVNPVADLGVMNLLEEVGGRLCGSEYLFCHALDAIDSKCDPVDALARQALADPMIGPAEDRARRVVADARRFGAEAVVVSRIPGASHCGVEARVISDMIEQELALPVLEIEAPPLSDAAGPALRTRLGALVEIAGERRRQ